MTEVVSPVFGRVEEPETAQFTKPDEKTDASSGTTAKPFDFDTLMSFNGQTIESASKAHDAMMEGMTAMTDQFSSFLSTRMERDFDRVRTLMGCRSSSELIQSEITYAQRTVAQYAEEYIRFLGLIGEIGKKSAAPFDKRDG